jgi:glyoxylase-like metal-dependent hydrolase (beta-lactamase superfamily II)
VDLGFVNVYLVGEPGGPWAIIDTGLDLHFEAIRAAAAERFGKDARPEAIYLTHGHGDHSGSAQALASYYDVPIYAHSWELPYLTGRASYPPLDPTVGGPFGLMSRFFPANQRKDLGQWIHPLPEGELPGLLGWQTVEVPGHTPGQVAFFRRTDRVLIAGDACATMNLEWLPELMARTQKLWRPPAPSTPDWVAARKSLRRLAELQPRVLACGHGVPMTGNSMTIRFFAFADHFMIPLKGRYVSDPAQFDENGVTFLPPSPGDPLPKVALGVGLAVAAGWGAYQINRRQKSRG